MGGRLGPEAGMACPELFVHIDRVACKVYI